MLGPRRVRVSMPSSLAPVFPGSISFTSCASSVCGYGSSKPARRSGVPGIGTAIRAPALIPRATPTATRFPRNCSTSGIGPSALPPSPTPNAISIMSPTSSTCAATSSLTAASLRHSTAKRRGAGCSRWKMAAAIPRASWSPPSGFFRRRRCRTFRVSFKGKSCHTQTPGCYIHAPDPRSTHEVTAEEREAFWEKLYAEPGFGIWQGNFRDMLTDRAANAMASDFIARKIRQRVHDPVVAEKLIPKNHGFGTRRVPLETGYYEVYNQPNVELVDINDTPIERITTTGIKTSDRAYEFDIIIYATGFDAITGAFDRIRRQCLQSVSRSAAYDTIVGIVDGVGVEPFSVIEPLPGQQEATEIKIRQQGRDRGALRGPPMSILRLRRASGRALVVLDHRCREPALDHGQERSIRDTSAHAAHQRPVRDRRKIVAEISIYHLCPAMVANVPEGLADCHLGVHLRAEAVLIAQQVRLEDRPQHQQRRHLDHAVADARDAERALAAVALWYPHAQQGLWPIVANPQLLPQLFQPSILPVCGDLVERHPVAAGGTVVTPACPVCFFEDVGPTHFVPQRRVEPKVRFGLSFRLQRGL